jgi:hypothetical protein
MDRTYSFADLCQALRRSQVFVRHLQSGLDLPVLRGEARYPEPYCIFLQKIVALRTLGIALEDLRDLFLREKKILEMLHVDTQTDSPTWYLDSCQLDGRSERRLFLTSHDVGFPLHAGVVQPALNFGDRNPELFSRREMGEDLTSFCQVYVRHLQRMKSRLEAEKISVRLALSWADRAC